MCVICGLFAEGNSLVLARCPLQGSSVVVQVWYLVKLFWGNI